MVGTARQSGHPVAVQNDQAAPTLVIMAAGLGSRFGGVKQLARVGPSNEAILDFSINDARAAGFGKIVLIIRSEIEADVREHLVEQHPGADFFEFVRQDDLGPARDKPWGTLHAVLSARSVLTEDFAVINADDYYGPASYQLAADAIVTLQPGEAANIAFEMGKTVPPQGAVTRALCEVEGGRLTAIVETDGCERLADGSLQAAGSVVAEDTPVSMNFWCFRAGVLADFEERWERFFAENADEAKAECQLPTVVGELMADDRLSVLVRSSSEQWIGITNPDDLELAQAALADR
jgi:NDP-sugar pyrophosphorylase family protein